MKIIIETWILISANVNRGSSSGWGCLCSFGRMSTGAHGSYTQASAWRPTPEIIIDRIAWIRTCHTTWFKGCKKEKKCGANQTKLKKQNKRHAIIEVVTWVINLTWDVGNGSSGTSRTQGCIYICILINVDGFRSRSTGWFTGTFSSQFWHGFCTDGLWHSQSLKEQSDENQ